VQRWNELAGRQVQDRILMIDYAPAQARSKGVISIPSCGWGQSEATMDKAPCASPPPTADGVEELYYQLVDIHAIAVMQLA
jgi:hypothetical protein